MPVIQVKLPSKKRNKIAIIRDKDLIDKENFIRRQNLEIVYPHLKKIEEERALAKKRKEEEAQRRLQEEQNLKLEEERLKKEAEEPKLITYKPVFSQEFVFTNVNKLVEIDLNKIVEPSLPIPIVKEEIQKSYDRGVQDGQIQAKATFQTEIEKYQEWIRSIESVAENFQNEYKNELKKIQSMVIDISTMVAKHLIGTEVLYNSDIVIDQVRKTIASLEDDKIFKLHLHPSDVDILTKVHSTLLPDEYDSKSIIITADTSVDRGGCLLETSAGFIDARISSQLEALGRNLKNTYAKFENENTLDKKIQEENNRIAELEKKKKEQDIELAMRAEWGDEFFDDDFEMDNFVDNNDNYYENESDNIVEYNAQNNLEDNIVNSSKTNEKIIESDLENELENNLDNDLSNDLKNDLNNSYDDDLNDLIFG